MPARNLLFVCSRNELRSPTAEQVFSTREDIEVSSAGLDPRCGNPVTPELVEWADLICVMERTHRSKLSQQFRPFLKGVRVVCLDIADDYDFMDPKLIALLEARVPPLLR